MYQDRKMQNQRTMQEKAWKEIQLCEKNVQKGKSQVSQNESLNLPKDLFFYWLTSIPILIPKIQKYGTLLLIFDCLRWPLAGGCQQHSGSSQSMKTLKNCQKVKCHRFEFCIRQLVYTLGRNFLDGTLRYSSMMDQSLRPSA